MTFAARPGNWFWSNGAAFGLCNISKRAGQWRPSSPFLRASSRCAALPCTTWPSAIRAKPQLLKPGKPLAIDIVREKQPPAPASKPNIWKSKLKIRK